MNDTTTRLDGFMADTDIIPPVRLITVETVRGKVEAIELPGLTTLKIEGERHTSVALMSYDPEVSGGVFVQMTPRLARNVGASLLHLANLIEEQVTQ